MSKTYYEEAKERWGDTAAWREFEKRSDPSKETGNGLMEVLARLGESKELPLESNEVQAAVADIQRYITEHYYDCTNEIFGELGEMYVADERFKKNIDEAGGDGTAKFARDAIRFYCNKTV